MVGKKMSGPGLADIMLEAGLIGSGSIQGVFTERHFERAMHYHKVVRKTDSRAIPKG
ncbi:hypothetical protein DPMN_083361 [Dreissena polymorpha]|uniref:Uncharacterized protein n=1 Tax=Dreissena polymorpha TaxID=45954 RepID=A0A9D4BJR6_DREPO|nr:hypothetical protein DPMN_083361 [Dreissena polymorpha]